MQPRKPPYADSCDTHAWWALIIHVNSGGATGTPLPGMERVQAYVQRETKRTYTASGWVYDHTDEFGPWRVAERVLMAIGDTTRPWKKAKHGPRGDHRLRWVIKDLLSDNAWSPPEPVSDWYWSVEGGLYMSLPTIGPATWRTDRKA